MAEDKPSNRFESEVIRLLQNVIVKIDGLEGKVDGLESKVDGLEAKIEQNSSDIRSMDQKLTRLSNQFSDVGVMAIKDNERIGDLEKRVDNIEAGIH